MPRRLRVSSGTLTAYKYLGAGTVVEEDYVQSQTRLTYLDSAGNVAGFDRFGRVADQVFKQYGANPSILDEYTYTYNRAGDRTSKTNVLHSALSETYTYDNLDRLIAWAVNGVEQKTWSLDSLGNNLLAGSYTVSNEEAPTGKSSGYDAAGSMTTLQSGDTAVYDAWNRLVEVDDGSTIVEKYAYDAANRRIQVLSNYTGSTPGTVSDDYYAGQQVVESDVTTGGVRDGGYQYVWSPRYVDAAILRDTLTTDGTAIVAADRLYYLADANYNVTAIVAYDSGTSTWQVVERYTYTPYGVVTAYDATWANGSSTPSTTYNNTILYTGRTYQIETGLYYYRARYYDAGLGRFISTDPIESTPNFYAYCGGNPADATDPWGLAGEPSDSPPAGFAVLTDADRTKMRPDSLTFSGTAFRPELEKEFPWPWQGLGLNGYDSWTAECKSTGEMYVRKTNVESLGAGVNLPPGAWRPEGPTFSIFNVLPSVSGGENFSRLTFTKHEVLEDWDILKQLSCCHDTYNDFPGHAAIHTVGTYLKYVYTGTFLMHTGKFTIVTGTEWGTGSWFSGNGGFGPKHYVPPSGPGIGSDEYDEPHGVLPDVEGEPWPGTETVLP